MLYICITLMHLFLMYCLVNQTILELLIVQLIVMNFFCGHPTDFIFYYFLDQIRQADMFCNFFIFLCLSWSFTQSWQGVPNPLYCLPPPPPFYATTLSPPCPTSTPTTLFVALFLCLNGWLCNVCAVYYFT